MSRFAHDLAEEDLTLEEFDVLVHWRGLGMACCRCVRWSPPWSRATS